MQAQTKTNIAPRWLGIYDASTYAGVSARLIENWIRDGLIVSSCVKTPGCVRGRRLIDRLSLDAFIESGIGERTAMPMNELRTKGGREQ